MAGSTNHQYHILDPDYMPFIGSMSAVTMTSGGVMAMHPEWAGGIGKYVLLLGFLGVIATI
ncbi:MAG TPA: cytochrome c oxidase subunit 3, partial [Novosphingobium sp.]|nr:cytochrome c oxidase subunit 3 [Novosphingobium sp.]